MSTLNPLEMSQHSSLPIPEMMRAIRYDQASEQLSLIDMPVPSLNHLEYLVKVSAAAITSGELTWNASAEPRQPFTPCVEFAGVISIAPDNGKFKPGTKVYMRVEFPNPGAAADYVTAIEAELTLRPTNLSAIQAAGVPVSALTAWQGLYEHSPRALQRNASSTDDTHLRILINGGSTSVGLWYMQLLRTMPIHQLHITATCSATSMDIVKNFGADSVCDRAKTRISDLTPKYDIIYDCIAGVNGSLDECWASLAPNGRLYTIVPPKDLREYGITRLPVPSSVLEKMGIEGYFFVMRPSAAQLDEITKLIEEGKVKAPLIRAEYELQEYEEAFRDVGKGAGKVVLRINDEE